MRVRKKRLRVLLARKRSDSQRTKSQRRAQRHEGTSQKRLIRSAERGCLVHCRLVHGWNVQATRNRAMTSIEITSGSLESGFVSSQWIQQIQANFDRAASKMSAQNRVSDFGSEHDPKTSHSRAKRSTSLQLPPAFSPVSAALLNAYGGPVASSKYPIELIDYWPRTASVK